MPGPVLHMGAVVTCAHGGQAIPTVPSPTVFVSGMPIATIAAPYAVAGCAFVPPAGNGPCVTGQWVVGATQVLSQRSASRHHDWGVALCPDRNATASGLGTDLSAGNVAN